MKYDEMFYYESGELFWKIRPREHFSEERIWKAANTRCAGKRVGLPDSSGYLRITNKGRCYLVHRIIFFLHHHYFPAQVDHINGNILDNRIENLRSATHSDNMCNSKDRKDRTLQVRGVTRTRSGDMWKVRVYRDGKTVVSLKFEDKELADLVAQEAQRKFHGEFAALRRI